MRDRGRFLAEQVTAEGDGLIGPADASRIVFTQSLLSSVEAGGVGNAGGLDLLCSLFLIFVDTGDPDRWVPVEIKTFSRFWETRLRLLNESRRPEGTRGVLCWCLVLRLSGERGGD